MPKRLPIKDIISGLLTSVGKAVRYWFHYTLVAIAWLGIVPLTASKFTKLGGIYSVLHNFIFTPKFLECSGIF
jgi:hypothetical protein